MGVLRSHPFSFCYGMGLKRCLQGREATIQRSIDQAKAAGNTADTTGGPTSLWESGDQAHALRWKSRRVGVVGSCKTKQKGPRKERPLVLALPGMLPCMRVTSFLSLLRGRVPWRDDM